MRNVTCSEDSGPCEVLIDGLTSVIDLAIGQDGVLYVVEYDKRVILPLFFPVWLPAGTSALNDLEGNLVEVVASDLSFPSAITFDNKGNIWLLENNNIALPGKKPTVRVLK